MAMINTPFINMLNTMVCNLFAKPFHRAINAPPIIIPPEKVTSIAVRRHMSGPLFRVVCYGERNAMGETRTKKNAQNTKSVLIKSW